MAEERIQLTIADGGLEASVQIEPGAALDDEALSAALAAAGVCFGVDTAAVAEIDAQLHDPAFALRERVIARGKPPRDGKDGAIDLAIEIGPLPGTQRRDGSLDWFERSTLTRIREGERIGSIRPPTPGRPGKSVDGNEIEQTAGAPVEPVLGDGVRLEEGGELVAARSGAVTFRGGNQLDVLEHAEHKGDVDMRSGHLKTDGSLTITGSVNANFEVQARGDVEVKGSIFGGRVEAGGSLRVGVGINAGETGCIDVGGDLIVRHAQMATLYADGHAGFATDSVGNEIRARSIEVGRRLMGGTATVETTIVAQETGSESGAPTRLRVAEPFSSPRLKVRRKAEALRKQRDLGRGQRGETEDRKERNKGGRRARASLAVHRLETERKRELLDERARLLPLAQIEVAGTVHPGVRVRFGSRRFDVETTLRAVRFSYDGESRSIIVAPL